MEALQRRVDEQPVSFRQNVFPSDLLAIQEILSSSGYFTPAEIGVAKELIEDRLIKGDKSEYNFLIAEVGGIPAGYTCYGKIACTSASFDLYWIAVHDRSRGNGLGGRLLASTEELTRQLGGERLYIETSGRAQYDSTRRFYLRQNYLEDAVLRDFYAPGDAKHIYVKDLRALC